MIRAVFCRHRDYSHSQDAGQQRSFYVKLIGEGVFDNGGPYRAVVNAACGEEVAGPLQFLIPCPNSQNNMGLNRDVMVFNASMTNPIDLGRLKLWGRLSGMSHRQDMLVSVSLPTLVFKACTGLVVDEGDLLEIDERASTAFRDFDACCREGSNEASLRYFALTVLQSIGVPDNAAYNFPSPSSLTFDTAKAFRDGAFAVAVRRGESQLAAYLSVRGFVCLFVPFGSSSSH